MSTVFVDTNVPMYAGGKEHPLRLPCQRVILAIASGEVSAVTDAEVFQEILYRYLHIGAREKGLQVFDLFHRVMMGRILAVGEQEILAARRRAATNPSLGARDLIHAAVMQVNGISAIVSVDRDFDRVQGIERIDPTSFE
jgi:predicted nucleic acid-binding protein